jgi:hypothetical protein
MSVLYSEDGEKMQIIKFGSPILYQPVLLWVNKFKEDVQIIELDQLLCVFQTESQGLNNHIPKLGT